MLVDGPTTMNGPDPLPRRIAAACAEILGDEYPPLLVAVSGGPDSAALAHLLRRIDRYPLILAHLNHRLRSEDEQHRERRAVERLAERLSVSLVTEDLDRGAVASAVRRGAAGLEAAARAERYRFLTRSALTAGAVLVTAHHRDDQAETVLLRLLSGRSLTGNALGIAADSRMASADGRPCRVIRPALELSRDDLRRWSDDHDLPYVLDASNSDLRFRRNLLRARVMPVVTEFYRDAPAALARLSREVGDLRAAVDALLPGDILRDARDGSVVAEYEVFQRLPRAARAIVLRRAIWRVSRRNRVDTTALDRFLDEARPAGRGRLRLADVEVLIGHGEIRVRPVVREVETGYLFTVREATIIEFRNGFVQGRSLSAGFSRPGARLIGPVEPPLVVRSLHPGDKVVRNGRARPVREVIREESEWRTDRDPPAILEDRRGILGIVWRKSIEALRDGADLVMSGVERPGFSPPLYLEGKDDSFYAE